MVFRSLGKWYYIITKLRYAVIPLIPRGPRYTGIPSITAVPSYRYKPENTGNTGISGFLPNGIEIVDTVGNPTSNHPHSHTMIPRISLYLFLSPLSRSFSLLSLALSRSPSLLSLLSLSLSLPPLSLPLSLSLLFLPLYPSFSRSVSLPLSLAYLFILSLPLALYLCPLCLCL